MYIYIVSSDIKLVLMEYGDYWEKSFWEIGIFQVRTKVQVYA